VGLRGRIFGRQQNERPRDTRCSDREGAGTAQLIDKTVKLHGQLDCLINNAGWHPPRKPIDEFAVDDFRSLFELNVFAACKFALLWLRQARGNIINMSSLVGTMGQRHATTYVATKGAIIAFTKGLAIDEAANGVRVNSVLAATFSRHCGRRRSMRQ
jgi:NAD(P)-dependent dehydrogenase (short-subunit alcohol dehydrogenase family)